MLTIVVDALSWILIVAGGGFCIVGAIGMLRMPDCFTRMHAASLIDTLGAALLLLGLMLQAGLSLNMLKIGMVGLLLFFASPTATHALAKAADAVMVGDTEFDIDMGRAAGIRTIGVRWGYHPANRLSRADGLIDRFAALDSALARIWGNA